MSDWTWKESPYGQHFEGHWEPGPKAQELLGKAMIKQHDIELAMFKRPVLFLFPPGSMPEPEGLIYGVPFIETDKVSEPGVVV